MRSSLLYFLLGCFLFNDVMPLFSIERSSVLTEEKQIQITGEVFSVDGEVIDYATVYLKNTAIGGKTDHQGKFQINANPGDYEMIISAMGYRTVFQKIHSGKQAYSYQIKMEPLVNEIKEVMVVAKTRSRKEREKGFAMSTVNTQKVALTNLKTSDLLNRASGVKLRQSGGAGSEIQYNINGMSGNAIRIFIDGIPMENYGTSFSVSSIPPSLIERIDIYKGVVPAHLTDDALGGAINIILKQPVGKSISTSYTFGSLNSHQWDLNGNYRNQKTGFTLQGSAFFNHSNNNYQVWGDPIKVTDPQTGKVQRIRAERFHDDYQSKGITFNTGVTRVKWADRFLLGLIYSDMGKEIQHGATMEVVYGNRHSIQHTIMGKLQYDKANLLPNLDIAAHATMARGNRQVVDTIPYMYNWRGEIMTDRNGNYISWNKGGGEAGKATLATNLEHTLTGRLRLAYHVMPSQTFSAHAMYNRFTRDVNDPYLSEAEQRLMDTRQVQKIIFGLDYDGKFFNDRFQTNLFYKFYHQKVQLTDPVMKSGEVLPETIHRTIANHGLGGALSFRVCRNLLLTASAENATRLPGVTELLGNSINNIQSSYHLKPERSNNLNVGVLVGSIKWGKHKLNADINFFYRDIRDMIQKSLTNLTDEMYGYENLGKIRSQGVDFELGYDYGGRVFCDLKFSYTDARFNLKYDKHGTEYLYYQDRLRNEPFFTLNWNVEYVAEGWIQKKSKTSITYNCGYVHQFYRNWESLGGAGKAIIPSQLVHDFGLVYTFPKKSFSLGVDIKNLLNEQVFDNWALQKPGRMFFGKLTYRLWD